MIEARRALCRWLLAGLLERGVDPAASLRRHRQRAVAVRTMTREEWWSARAGRPGAGLSKIRFLPLPGSRSARALAESRR